MHVSRHQPATGPTLWARLLLVLSARAYRAMLLTLTVIALAPLLLGWGSCVVQSGSMQPSISVGDVVVVKPTAITDRVHVGRVYLFEDPARPERQLVHRIVERRDDGDYTTAGDANQLTDSTPLTSEGIRAQAIVLVPYVGLPVHWLRTGDWLRFTLWLLVTMGAFVLATRRVEGDPPAWLPKVLRKREPPRKEKIRRLVPVATATALLVVGGATTGAAGAGFSDQTNNGSNRWTVGAWVQRYVAAVMTDNPDGFWLLDEPNGASWAQDRSGYNRTGQYYGSLDQGIEGGLPNNPGTGVSNSGGRVILGPREVSAPSSYSVEVWFRASANSGGGYLAGFENDRDANYSWWYTRADRSILMEPSGKLTFGVWPGSKAKEELTTQQSYMDGNWHHLVVTSANRNTIIYVDGVSASGDSKRTAAVSNYAGFWRIGQGSIDSWSGTSSFSGDLDNVAIYNSVLSSSRVAAHWAAR